MRRCWCCCCWWKRQRLISTLLAVAQALLSIGSVVDARLKAAVILPHGDFAFDPSLVPVADSAARDAAEAIAAAARSVGQWLGSSSSSVTSSSSVDPDLIFLSTPHGVSMSNDFAVYLNAAASGTVEIGADLHQNSSSSYYTVTLPPIPLAPILAQELVNQLTTVLQQHQNVTGVEIPGGDTPLLLQWAEVIPLLLIARRQPLESKQSVQSLLRQTTTTTIVNKNPLTSSDNNTPRQHLIWTHPLRRYTTAPAMVTELLHLGDWLGTWLDALPINVAVVISGDLSHTHESTGPYGYSATAALMDAALGSWAADPCANADDLLVTAAALQNRALSCGFTGFVLLHGILCGGGDGGNRRGGRLEQQQSTRVEFAGPRQSECHLLWYDGSSVHEDREAYWPSTFRKALIVRGIKRSMIGSDFSSHCERSSRSVSNRHQERAYRRLPPALQSLFKSFCLPAALATTLTENSRH